MAFNELLEKSIQQESALCWLVIATPPDNTMTLQIKCLELESVPLATSQLGRIEMNTYRERRALPTTLADQSSIIYIGGPQPFGHQGPVL